MKQNEIRVNVFCDLIRQARQPVRHAAHQVKNQGSTQSWEYELAGAYIIGDSQRTHAYASDGLRLARFTTSPIGGLDRYFYPDCHKKSNENYTFYDKFNQIFTEWNLVRNCAIYEKEHLIKLCTKSQIDGIITIPLGLTVIKTHILDFCHATPENLITCLVVYNQSNSMHPRLKLIARQLEEIIIPII